MGGRRRVISRCAKAEASRAISLAKPGEAATCAPMTGDNCPVRHTKVTRPFLLPIIIISLILAHDMGRYSGGSHNILCEVHVIHLSVPPNLPLDAELELDEGVVMLNGRSGS